MTNFSPIDGASPSDFTRLYVDTFISGFTEGGEFSALVSMNFKDKSIDVKERLKALFDDFKKGAGDGKAHANADSIESETTITVSSIGGGDIQDADAGGWTLERLKSATLTFPQRVIDRPARTGYRLSLV